MMNNTNNVSRAAPLDENAPLSEQSQTDQPKPSQKSEASVGTQGFDSSPKMTQDVWGHLMPVEAGVVLELNKETTTIGRGNECDITLPVPQMSTHHCTIHYERDGTVACLEDCSTNGTWVNKKKIHKSKALLGDSDSVLFVPASKRRGRKKIAYMFKLTAPVKLDDSGKTLADSFEDNYRIIKSLGSGAFAEVKLVRKRILSDDSSDSKSNDKDYLKNIDFAMKEINKEQWQRIKQATARNITLLDEVKIMQRAGDHENIVSVIEYFEEKDKVYVIMDYCDGGDMLDYIQTHNKYDNEKARDIFKQMTSAVDYLHSELSIAHRDLKPDNILLCGKESNKIKISDFGISRKSTKSMVCQTIIGTPLYQAPEVQLHRHKHKNGYDGKLADYWSMGVILYIMLVAAPPATEPADIVKMADMHAIQWYNEPVVETAQDLIYALLKVKPSERIKSKEILQHPWILGYDTMQDYDNSLSNDKTKDNDRNNNNSNNSNNSNNNGNSNSGPDGNDGSMNNNNSNNNANNNSNNGNNSSSGGNSGQNHSFSFQSDFDSTGAMCNSFESTDDSKHDITPSMSSSVAFGSNRSNRSIKSGNMLGSFGAISNMSSSGTSSSMGTAMEDLNEKLGNSQLSTDESESTNDPRKENDSQHSNSNKIIARSIDSSDDEEDDDLMFSTLSNTGKNNNNFIKQNNNNNNNKPKKSLKRKCRSPSIPHSKSMERSGNNGGMNMNMNENGASRDFGVSAFSSFESNGGGTNHSLSDVDSKSPPKKRQRIITAS